MDFEKIKIEIDALYKDWFFIPCINLKSPTKTVFNWTLPTNCVVQMQPIQYVRDV